MASPLDDGVKLKAIAERRALLDRRARLLGLDPAENFDTRGAGGEPIRVEVSQEPVEGLVARLRLIRSIDAATPEDLPARRGSRAVAGAAANGGCGSGGGAQRTEGAAGWGRSGAESRGAARCGSVDNRKAAGRARGGRWRASERNSPMVGDRLGAPGRARGLRERLG